MAMRKALWTLLGALLGMGALVGVALAAQETYELRDGGIYRVDAAGKATLVKDMEPGRFGTDKVMARMGEKKLIERVTDHGAGIEAQHVPRLTERFYRVDAESSRKKKGTGLGLWQVKNMADQLGARVEVARNPQRGVTFSVWLPPERSKVQQES